MRFLALLLVMTGCGLQTVDEQAPLRAPETVEAVGPVSPVTATPVKERTRFAFQWPAMNSGEFTRTLNDTTTQIQLLLNADTVFCSAIGYSGSFLKVSVPDLDRLARFDHRANTLGLPCAAAGRCTDVLGPETILQSRPGVESVSIRVILTEVLTVDVEGKRCQRLLREEVRTEVRGIPLRHHAQGQVEEVPFETCKGLAALWHD